MKKYTDTGDNSQIIQIIGDYLVENGEYPTTGALRSLYSKHRPLFPSVRHIQKKLGGIRRFYASLGIDYLDARTSVRRSSIATMALENSIAAEKSLGTFLEKIFGEPNVHRQAPYNKRGKTLHRADFKIFKDGRARFFIDIFEAQDAYSMVGCVNIKLSKIGKSGVDSNLPVYLVSVSEWVSPYDISEYVKRRKNKLPSNIRIMDINSLKKDLSSGAC